MSIERAQLNRARTFMLAEKAGALVRSEAGKGCRPEISRRPVALEPRFQHIYEARPVCAVEAAGDAVPEPPEREDCLIRLRVWMPSDHSADWQRSERFLKQLVSVTHRIGFEIIGNEDDLVILLLCHVRDFAVIRAAFRGEFASCELLPEQRDLYPDLAKMTSAYVAFADHYPPPPYSHLLTRLDELHTTPFEPLMAAMSSLPRTALGVCQVMFQPVDPGHNWHQNIEALLDLEFAVKMLNGVSLPMRYAQQAPSGDLRQMACEVENKAHSDKPLFAAALRVAVVGTDDRSSELLRSVSTFTHLYQHGGRALNRLTQDDFAAILTGEQIREMFALGATYRPGFLVSSWELAGLVHLPPSSVLDHRTIQLEMLDTLPVPSEKLSTGTTVGTRTYAGREVPVCIPDDLRRRHTHIIGRPDMGKSVLLEHMILDDLQTGAGVLVIDPHGDLIERLLDRLPEEHIDRTIYFNPGDPDWVPLWNPLQPFPGQDPARVADELVAGFKSFVIHWGDRLERFLREAFFALQHLPGSTLLDVSTVLSNQSNESIRLQNRILEVVDGAEPRQFWKHDFAKYRKDDLGPPKNKLSKLLVGGTVALMFSQPDCAFNFRRIMDDGMILLVNFSTIGPDVRGVLGSLLLSLVHMAALSRSDTPIDQRRQFHIFCDEAPVFVTDALENLIAETRKYRVSLTLAHQFFSQFNGRQADALSSTGSTIIFNVDHRDAVRLTKDLRGLVAAEDLITLEKFEAILRAGTEIVRINTPEFQPVIGKSHREQIIAESRRRYYKPIAEVRRALRGGADRPGGVRMPVACSVSGGPTEELEYEEFSA